MTTRPDPRRTSVGASAALVLTGLLLLAVNLRPAAVSVGPVLSEVRDSLGLSAASAGVLTSLPVLAFAVFGAAAPASARRLGVHRVVLVALLVVGCGLVARALVHQEAAFLVLSLLTLGGMAMANVLIPSLVRLHFPDRVGAVTSLYTTVLSLGLTAAFVLTVPISHAMGTWRAGLAAWAVLAFVAAVPWLLLQRDRAATPVPSTSPAVPRTAPHRRARRGPDPAGLGDGGVLRDAVDARLRDLRLVRHAVARRRLLRLHGRAARGRARAGLGADVVPGAPPGRRGLRPVLVLLAVSACYPVGFAGLLLAPASTAVLWAVVVGVGTATFPVVLVLIGLRARTPAGTAALSSFTQSVGYLFSAIGPLGVGLLHGATGGWGVPLAAMTAVVVPLVVSGAVAIAQPPLEDHLDLH